MEARKLKKVVIKEELFALTNDTFEAIILGQLLYWQERIKDFDKFIDEERERKNNNCETLNLDNQNGWIYKSSKDLIDECMLTISVATMRRYIQKLISKGFIESRNNPQYKWDKKLQYRVNLDFVISEIKKLGYDGLSGYKSSSFHNEHSMFQNEKSELQNETAIADTINRDYIKEKEDKSSLKKSDANVDLFGNVIEQKKEDNQCDDDFVDEIYRMYPSKCPMRNISTGKCSKNRAQISKLLKTYSRDEIRAVVQNELDEKLGKHFLSNFGTFLNNFPDPKELDINQSNEVNNQAPSDNYIFNGVEYK